MAVVAAVGAAPALAADPSFDCAAAESAAERAICADSGLAALDRRLAEVWRAALTVAEDVADAETALPRLRAEQRGWIKGRDECWKAEDGVDACVERRYRDRIAELQAEWMLVDAGEPAFWRCDDGSEVVVTAMASDTPTARLELGDTTLVAHHRPAASGVRWEASFGRWFWEKGVEAAASFDQNATPLTCDRVE